ncbi:hypothetical protein [Microcoleus sp. N3A4]|uniref:hypothetical protein n=1 Tax=Microcoleus sp. N3A4 TaxID=3055379 RepID=UPI002FD5930C
MSLQVMARFSLYPVSNTKFESAPSQFGNPCSSNWNIKQRVPVAAFLALHNCGMIVIVLWDGLSYPEGVYFKAGGTPHKHHPNCATLIF